MVFHSSYQRREQRPEVRGFLVSFSVEEFPSWMLGRGRTQTTLQNQELIPFSLLLRNWIFSGESGPCTLDRSAETRFIVHRLSDRGVEGLLLGAEKDHLSLGAEAQPLPKGSGRPSPDTHGRLAAALPLVLSDPANYSSFLWLTLFLNDITFSISLMVLCPSA